jgi:hypothetical protein
LYSATGQRTVTTPLIYQNCLPSISLVLWRGPHAKSREGCIRPVFKWPCYQSQSYGAREHITSFVSLITCYATREMYEPGFLSCFLAVFMTSKLAIACLYEPNAKCRKVPTSKLYDQMYQLSRIGTPCSKDDDRIF